MFELDERSVHALTSRLMGEELLPGAHDGPTSTIVIHHAEPSRLQVRFWRRPYGSSCTLCCFAVGLQPFPHSSFLSSFLIPPIFLKNLAGSFIDKAAVLVDLNERALAMRTGEPASRR